MAEASEVSWGWTATKQPTTARRGGSACTWATSGLWTKWQCIWGRFISISDAHAARVFQLWQVVNRNFAYRRARRLNAPAATPGHTSHCSGVFIISRGPRASEPRAPAIYPLGHTLCRPPPPKASCQLEVPGGGQGERGRTQLNCEGARWNSLGPTTRAL